VAFTTAVRAQQPVSADSTPFRGGQWAAQFGGGASFVSLGVIRFRSPTRARVLDLTIQGSHEELMNDSAFVGLSSQANLNLRLGARRYRALSHGVVAYHTVGVTGGFAHGVTTSPGGSIKLDGWNVGVFGDAGGSYLISPSFSIGANAGLGLGYRHTTSGAAPGGPQLREWLISGGVSVTFNAAIYF
jgi:hypothetical protein